MDLTGTVSYLIMIVHAGQVSPALITSDFYQSLQRDIFLNPQSTNFKKILGKLALFPGTLFSLLRIGPHGPNHGTLTAKPSSHHVQAEEQTTEEA